MSIRASQFILAIALKAISILAILSWLAGGQNSSADTFTVTNNADSGNGSLRKAITDMNALGVSPSEIVFSISGSMVINLQSQLPSINVSCDVNPTSVSGIVLDGTFVSSGSGLRFTEQTVQISTVVGLEIRDFPAAGIVIATASNERGLSSNHALFTATARTA